MFPWKKYFIALSCYRIIGETLRVIIEKFTLLAHISTEVGFDFHEAVHALFENFFPTQDYSWNHQLNSNKSFRCYESLISSLWISHLIMSCNIQYNITLASFSAFSVSFHLLQLFSSSHQPHNSHQPHQCHEMNNDTHFLHFTKMRNTDTDVPVWNFPTRTCVSRLFTILFVMPIIIIILISYSSANSKKIIINDRHRHRYAFSCYFLIFSSLSLSSVLCPNLSLFLYLNICIPVTVMVITIIIHSTIFNIIKSIVVSTCTIIKFRFKQLLSYALQAQAGLYSTARTLIVRPIRSGTSINPAVHDKDDYDDTASFSGNSHSHRLQERERHEDEKKSWDWRFFFSHFAAFFFFLLYASLNRMLGRIFFVAFLQECNFSFLCQIQKYIYRTWTNV